MSVVVVMVMGMGMMFCHSKFKRESDRTQVN
jgi:hypothetical protein